MYFYIGYQECFLILFIFKVPEVFPSLYLYELTESRFKSIYLHCTRSAPSIYTSILYLKWSLNLHLCMTLVVLPKYVHLSTFYQQRPLNLYLYIQYKSVSLYSIISASEICNSTLYWKCSLNLHLYVVLEVLTKSVSLQSTRSAF